MARTRAPATTCSARALAALLALAAMTAITATAAAQQEQQGEQIAECGSCTLWLDGEPGVDAELSARGECVENCTDLDLVDRGIVRIANGTFAGMPALQAKVAEVSRTA